MSNVDEFLQFVAEEVNKEGDDLFVLEAPQAEPYPSAWGVHVGEKSQYAEQLVEALNRTSMEQGFTSKRLRYVEEEPSLAKRVAELAAMLGCTVSIQAPKILTTWSIEIEKLNLRVSAFSFQEALNLTLDDLMSRGAE